MTTETAIVPALGHVALLDLVTEIYASPRLWQHHVAFHENRRYWAKVLTRPDVDVWLLTWLRGQHTEFHDHGVSLAAFTVVEGEVVETRPDLLRGDVFHRTLAKGSRTTVPPYAFHAVTNPATEPAISIHAYSPPLRVMTYFDAAPEGLVPTRREVMTGGNRP